MSSPTFASTSHRNDNDLRVEERVEAQWFDETPPSSRVRPSVPPVRVGEFLGDPEVDGWLR